MQPSEQAAALIVAPHPDDETLGAGIWLYRNRNKPVHLLHVTDGSPKDLVDARNNGLTSRRAYALRRRQELAKALLLANVPLRRCHEFRCPDREAYLRLPQLIDYLDRLIARLEPVVVFSPAYEGGHPDHDAAALATAMVYKRRRSFVHREFPLYHAGPKGQLLPGKFLFHDVDCPEELIVFSESERELKSRMLKCFATQTQMLSQFPVAGERFRRAPAYNFAEAPHPGLLLYESWGWGISGDLWRRQAAAVLRSSGRISRATS